VPSLRFAPFNTTSNRTQPGAVAIKAATPGPGQYTRGEADSAGRPSPASAFASGTARNGVSAGPPPKADAPGPGEYRLPSDFEKRRRRHTGRVRAASAGFRQHAARSTPPSIPARDQSFGYEEEADRTLVMQRPPPTAPRYSEPDSKLTRPSGFATAWGNSKVQREVFGKPPATPGPGQYYAPVSEPAAPAAAAARARLTTAAFADGSLRLAEADPEEPTPGPGQYRLPGAMRQHGGASFGSTVPRNGLGTEVWAAGPGPGAYSLRKDQVVRASSAFNTSQARFTKSSRADEPGPGAFYDTNAHSIAAELERRTHGRQGAFGSASKRFGVARSAANDQPGPGSYDPRPATAPVEEVEKATAAFASGTRRNFQRAERAAPTPSGATAALEREQPRPGPMAYLVSSGNVWDTPQQAHGGRGTFSASDRFPAGSFQGRRIESSPGPGAYAAPHPRDAAPRPTSVSGSFPKEGRFHGRAAVAPGPGQYGAPNLGSSMLLKRSHNITAG